MAGTSAGPLVSVRGLAKTYFDGKRALDGVDLDVEPGMLGLLGPNGAGKTTFLSILTLVREPSSGTRTYFGLDPKRARDRAAIRGLIGYLPQDFAPVPTTTGREYLLHCGRLRGMRSRPLVARVDALLDAVGLTSAARRLAGEYSGGMRRRLGIAQAFLHSPKLVVVDEPTAGLDPEERIRFRNLVSDMAESTAVLLSTHVVEDVEATCPRLLVIGRGRLLFDGAPAELLRRCVGRIFELQVGASPPAGALLVGHRIDESGRSRVVVDASAPPPGATPREPNLEWAYSSFLAQHGIEREPDA